MDVERTFLTVRGADNDTASPIRVLICSKHRVLRAGLRLLVETDARINVFAETDSVSDAAALAQLEHADIILLDEDSCDTTPETMWMALQVNLRGTRVLLLHDADARDSARTHPGAQGLRTISKGDAPESLLQAIRTVHAGDGVRSGAADRGTYTATPEPVHVPIDDARRGLPGFDRRLPQRMISDRRVIEVLATVERDLQMSHSIETLAKKVGMGGSRLRHLLRDLVGISLSKFRNERRLEVAAHLLAHSHRRVSDIAHQVGFSDLAYFDKAFRKRFGLSPTRYRHANPLRTCPHTSVRTPSNAAPRTTGLAERPDPDHECRD